MGTSDRFVWWLGRKLGSALLLAGLLLAGLGLWMFLRDQGDFAAGRQDRVTGLTAETGRLKEALGGTETRMAAIRVEIVAQKERAEQAARVARQLDELSSGLNRLTAGSAQLQENGERMARMKEMEANSLKRSAELEQALVRNQWEKDGLEIALARKQQELGVVLADNSQVRHYVRETWTAYGRWVLLAVAVVALGPVFLSRSRPG